MKFIVRFRELSAKIADLEVEAKDEEEVDKLLNDEDNEEIWYEAADKLRHKAKDGFKELSVMFVKEKSAYEEEKKGSKKATTFTTSITADGEEKVVVNIDDEDLPF